MFPGNLASLRPVSWVFNYFMNIKVWCFDDSVSMLGPSPDWIVGVSGLEMCQANCSWIKNKVNLSHTKQAGIINVSGRQPINTQDYQRWEFIKENKKTRTRPWKRSRKQELDQESDQEKRKNFLFSWSLSWSSSCFLIFLTFLFSFVNSHLWMRKHSLPNVLSLSS